MERRDQIVRDIKRSGQFDKWKNDLWATITTNEV